MTVTGGPRTVEVLVPVACDRHLRQETIGRLAVLVDGHPEIFPVNYAMSDKGEIVFRTDPGTKLDALTKPDAIALEIDGIDEDRHSGWSVLVVGAAVRVGNPEELARLRELALEPWAAGEKAQFVRVSPTKITGRRVSSR